MQEEHGIGTMGKRTAQGQVTCKGPVYTCPISTDPLSQLLSSEKGSAQQPQEATQAPMELPVVVGLHGHPHSFKSCTLMLATSCLLVGALAWRMREGGYQDFLFGGLPPVAIS